MEKPILKAYYKNIFFEFLTHKNASDTIIILPGFPSSNNNDNLMRFLYSKGFNVFFLRYGGSYQSKGFFLEKNVVKEIGDFVKNLKKVEVTSLWDMSKQKFKIKKLIIIGGSFSGAISCGLAATNKSIKKIILFSPVWDYKEHNKKENEQDLIHLSDFVKRAYKNLYRIKFDNIVNQMEKFKELSPNYYVPRLNIPLLVFHDPNDPVVSIAHTRKMKKILSKINIVEHKIGHGMRKVLFDEWDKIEDFLRR